MADQNVNRLTYYTHRRSLYRERAFVLRLALYECLAVCEEMCIYI